MRLMLIRGNKIACANKPWPISRGMPIRVQKLNLGKIHIPFSLELRNGIKLFKGKLILIFTVKVNSFSNF